MGADMIGYLVVGPAELDKSKEKRQALLARAAKEKKLIDEISEILGAKELEDADYAEQLEALSEEQRTYIEGLNDSREADGWHREEENVTELLDWADEIVAPEAIEGIIDNLFALWEGGARDSMSRGLPGDPSKCILMCGEPSWGDEPEGFGYQTLKMASRAELFEAYGIT
jgi:hypothetical protein